MIKDLNNAFIFFRSLLGVRMYMSLMLVFFSGLFEVVGVMMFIPFVDYFIVEGGADNEVNYVVEKLILLISVLGFEVNQKSIGVTIAFLIFVKAATQFSSLWFVAQMRSELVRRLKYGFFESMGKLRFENFLLKDTGYYVNLIGEQSSRSVIALGFFIQLIGQFLTAFVYLAAVIIASPVFGSAAVMVGLFFFLVFRVLSKEIKRLSFDITRNQENLVNNAIQFLTSFKYIRATGEDKDITKDGKAAISGLSFLEKRIGILNALLQSVREPLGLLIVSTIIYVMSAIYGLQLSIVLAIVYLFYKVVITSFSIQANLNRTLEYIGSVRYFGDAYEDIERNAISIHQGGSGISKISEVEFKNVYYDRESRSDPVLNNVSISLCENQFVGIVGPSGSGKTTLLDILLNVFEPSEGAVLINGVDLKNIDKKEYQSRVGYVPQDSILFNGTIIENISLNNCDNEVDFNRLEWATKCANINRFINSLPDGYRTDIGDKGQLLSGGQRQRMFLARELYKMPDLLVLDEATSALDSESELVIRENMKQIKKRMIVVMVAHRVDSLLHADMVVNIDGGRVITVAN